MKSTKIREICENMYTRKLVRLWYADFERILVLEKKLKSKIQMNLMLKNIKNMLLAVLVISYELVSLLSHLGKDAVYNFVNCMIEESKYCSDVMKKSFNKKIVMTKTDDEDFKNCP